MKLPKVIDLFSGCGGLALGFQRAGFEIASGIELVEDAVLTASSNISWKNGKEDVHICGDITETSSEVFKDSIGEEGCIVIGGPPCQAYSLAGRGKLNSLGRGIKNSNDPRGYLFEDFLRIALELDASAVVMENVPASTTFGEINVPERVCSILSENGYKAFWTLLNSADFGVPQKRERVFVIGIKDANNSPVELPVPLFRSPEMEIRTGYDLFSECTYFRVPLIPSQSCRKWVTTGEAISDLPSLLPESYSKYRLHPPEFLLPYRTEAQNSYQKEMREWFDGFNMVSGNSFRNTKRDFPIFERMEQGANYIDATNIAEEIFMEYVTEMGINENSPQYNKLYKKMVPEYTKEKFESKWKRLSEDLPSHTITAHLSKDTYSHIHPTEPRGISVREAARLQSFPDGFTFGCSMGEAFRQIGNAVPPLLSYAVAKCVRKAFSEENEDENIG